MKKTIATRKIQNIAHEQEQAFVIAVPDMNRAELLTEANTAEVLDFLTQRPVHTVVMVSYINDNGIESEDNRGKYYGYRNREGNLEGVALIGHTTLVESRTEESLRAFAEIARTSEIPPYIMMSDGKTIEKFWMYFANINQKPRLVCTELLFEINFPFLVQECKWDLRLAKAEELMPIAEAHAEVAEMESGSNPMERDREGYLKRVAKRIERERTFVVFDEDGELVFKADIVGETKDVIYLEGIYVSPAYRGQGVGPKCLAKLSLDLLERVSNICLLSNVDFKDAHRSFEKSGFKNTDQCQTIFV